MQVLVELVLPSLKKIQDGKIISSKRGKCCLIRENQLVLNRMNALTDAVILIIASALAFIIRFKVMSGDSGDTGFKHYIAFAIVVAPFFIFIYSLSGLYESFRGKRFLNELSIIIKSNFVGTLVIIVFLFMFKAIHISRVAVFIFFIIFSILVSIKRYLLRKILKKYRMQGINLKHILLLGSGNIAKNYISTIERNKSLGLHIIGYIAKNNALDDMKYLGQYSNIEEVILNYTPDEIVVALDLEDYNNLDKIIRCAEKTGTKISIIPFFSKYIPAKPYIDEIDDISLINIRRIPLDNIANGFIKRNIDIIGSLIGIILFSPIMLIIAILVKLSSKGDIIFRQERIGLNKKIFIMYKFRSMKLNSQQDTAWSKDIDPRKTKVGAFIRKFSLDELPQLFNILKGDMSIIGPRPEIKYFVEQFRETVPLYMLKHQVRPGLTGLAQVEGFRGDTSIEERIKRDIYYIEHWTLLLDIKIFFITLFKGFKNTEKL